MTDPYPEARRQARIDRTDHKKFIEGNWASLEADRQKQLQNRIEHLTRLINDEEVSIEETKRLKDKRSRLRRKLEDAPKLDSQQVRRGH